VYIYSDLVKSKHYFSRKITPPRNRRGALGKGVFWAPSRLFSDADRRRDDGVGEPTEACSRSAFRRLPYRRNPLMDFLTSRCVLRSALCNEWPWGSVNSHSIRLSHGSIRRAKLCRQSRNPVAEERFQRMQGAFTVSCISTTRELFSLLYRGGVIRGGLWSAAHTRATQRELADAGPWRDPGSGKHLCRIIASSRRTEEGNMQRTI
jgi:hypothetical protein